MYRLLVEPYKKCSAAFNVIASWVSHLLSIIYFLASHVALEYLSYITYIDKVIKTFIEPVSFVQNIPSCSVHLKCILRCTLI